MFFVTSDTQSLREMLEELYPQVIRANGAKAKGESDEAFALRMNADKETEITRMAVNTGIAARALTMQQIVKIIRQGMHLASSPVKFGDGKATRRDVFLIWLEHVGIQYTVNQSELSRLVKFYLDTLPIIERVSGSKLSDEGIYSLHKDQGDITSTHIQRIANEWVETLERSGLFTKNIAARILRELESQSANATALSEELKAYFSSSVSTPETLSETSVITKPPKAAEGSYRDLTDNRIRLVVELDRSLLPVVKRKLSEVGIDIDSLQVMEE